jgi:5,6-dimethylbenzimidazole synthase
VTDGGDAPPVFDAAFRRRLADLILWRRDVRRFRADPLAPEVIDRLIALACLSPSVGNAQPWRFVLVEDAAARARVRASYAAANAEALHAYAGEKARLYATLKLSGFDKAPVQMAVFCDTAPEAGAGLGQRTMPLTLHYSVAGAVQTLALAARAEGVGVGVVSILDPEEVRQALAAPAAWDLVAYLCLGYPEEEHADPELERFGWQERLPWQHFVSRR